MEHDAEMEKVIERVRKLLNLAAKNPNENEAALAAAKAQELLSAYNLELTTIEQGSSGSGKREDARQRGGMYLYERELWHAIAELNFCWYFTTRGFMKNKAGKRQYSFQHRIVGRVVNTTATKVMGEYLQGAIERLCRERFPVNSQFFTREAVAYREGMADNIYARLREKRREIDREEKRKKDEAAQNGATAFALTIADVKDAEHAANYDFLHGEGAWAKKQQLEQEWDRKWEERQRRQAEAAAAAEAAYNEWAAANPEEAAKEAKRAEAEQRKKDRAASRRSFRPRYRAPTAREQRADSSYYSDGYRRGNDVSLDQQVGDRAGQRRLR